MMTTEVTVPVVDTQAQAPRVRHFAARLPPHASCTGSLKPIGPNVGGSSEARPISYLGSRDEILALQLRVVGENS